MRIALLTAEDFNIGVAYVSAYYKSQGHIVKLFFDPRRIDISVYLIRQIINFNPDMIGISCITANVGWALNMAKLLRRRLPYIRIVFGGVHPTLCPKDFRDYEVFSGKIDMDYNLIFPDREIFFEQLPPIHRKVQMFMTGFGCPFRCSFCNNYQLHKGIFRRNIDSCIQELRIQKEKGLRYVLFEDDIFTLNSGWLSDFLDRYRIAVNLPFTCFGHTYCLNDTIISKLRKCCCEWIWLGIQTGNERLRKDILNRYETNEQIQNTCQLIKQNGLKLMIDHIFGIPTETIDDLIHSYNFYKKLRPDVVNCYEMLYFPKAKINEYGTGTALYQKQGGLHYKRYAKSFSALPLTYN